MRIEDVTQEWLDDALATIERMRVIRDAFLEGRDVDAINLLRDEGETHAGFVGIGGDRIRPSEVVTLRCNPQRPFRPMRFAVVEPLQSAAFDFEIISITAGNNFIGGLDANPVHADHFLVNPATFTFAPDDSGIMTIKFPEGQRVDRFGIGLHSPRIMPGQDLRIVIRNRHPTLESQFQGIFVGAVSYSTPAPP